MGNNPLVSTQPDREGIGFGREALVRFHGFELGVELDAAVPPVAEGHIARAD